MQLADKTRSSAALITMTQRPIKWVAGSFVLSMVLAGCSTNTPAPITDIHSSTPSSAGSMAGGSYTVQPGDTLYKIAQQHGTSVQAIASANGITDPSQLRVGQVLSVGGGSTVAAAPTRSTLSVPATTTPVDAEPATPVAEPKESSPVNTTSPRASDASLINWGWPATGAVIQGFTANTKGIDIEGAIGDPIVAAASGKVMYAGNGVRGLGNLILLGHSNGFITAYAHNESLLVKTGQEISKGEKIATLGQSDTTSPRLHFEVRRRGTPVNPLSYLPSR
ncbi:MAG TPA: peptidoglycan DD-metalloendopeptidase family protein [Alcaligenaceae bacterium]|nr:peptidoglycan DD-metalloendopeptidase family protein [Alcaligenaceae bacterium]